MSYIIQYRDYIFLERFRPESGNGLSSQGNREIHQIFVSSGYWNQRFMLLLVVVWIVRSFIMFLLFDTHATLSDAK